MDWRARPAVVGMIGTIILGQASIWSEEANAGSPPPAIASLMSDPVSLFDWGLYRADKDASEAAIALNEAEDKAAKWEPQSWDSAKSFVESRFNQSGAIRLHEIGYKFEFGYAQYDFNSRKIEVGFAVEPPGLPNDTRTPEQMTTAEACVNLLNDARDALFYKLGRVTAGNPELYPEVALVAIQTWFSHSGFARSNQPQDLYPNLLKSTVLVISLSQYLSDKPRVRCTAALAGGIVTTTIDPTAQ